MVVPLGNGHRVKLHEVVVTGELVAALGPVLYIALVPCRTPWVHTAGSRAYAWDFSVCI